MINIDNVIEFIHTNGYRVILEKKLSNNTGIQLKLNNNSIINVYNRGTFFVQGKNSEEVRKLIFSVTWKINKENNCLEIR